MEFRLHLLLHNDVLHIHIQQANIYHEVCCTMHLAWHVLTQLLQVLKVVGLHKSALKADSLQQLHAMHNLAGLLESKDKLPIGIAPTLRDASLQRDADSIREVQLCCCSCCANSKAIKSKIESEF